MKKNHPLTHIFLLISFILLLTNCSKEQVVSAIIESKYGSQEDMGVIENINLDEASGLIESRQNPGYFWSFNSSGHNTNVLYYFDKNGKGTREFVLNGIPNRDWEDMAIVDNKGASIIYLADFGDNNFVWPSYKIYWFEEPKVQQATINSFENINSLTFKLPDGPHDMECLLVDQITRDIFVISKRELSKRLYKISASNVKNNAVVTAEFIQELNFSKPFSTDPQITLAYYITAGSVSSDNSEILIKNYVQVYYWKRKLGESIPETLSRPAKLTPYIIEPQGEGITFSNSGNGYYTISSKASDPNVHLYFYPKL